MPTASVPAAFESATTQLLVVPTANFSGLQVSDDRFGVDHSSTVAFPEEAPRVALTTACVLEITVPAITLMLALEFPAETVTVAGIESRAELEFSATVLAAGTARDSVIEQVVPAPDINPVELQVTDETSTGARRQMVMVFELVPRVAVTIAF
jgi:hypothetical protein